jgi:catechol 2,3-dioxygenase-like lactoylglutathione lyase family enzyme
MEPSREVAMPDNPLADPKTPPKLLTELPERLHHHAFAVKDQEANRQFIEDVLGIPLVATWCEKTFRPELGREVEYCHTFFELADGGALAFFQYADDEMWERNRARFHETGNGGAWHIAFKVSQATFDELKRRIEAAKVPLRVTDHGYCLSMYVSTPDQLRLEFTVDVANVAEIAAMRRADAHSELKRWLAGDRRTNNDDRPH